MKGEPQAAARATELRATPVIDVENPVWGPDWPEVRALWSLDRTSAHLNHGSFGAVPLPVQRAQDEIRRIVQANPTGFFWRALEDRLDEARHTAAEFLHADPDGFAFVPNATTAVSTVLGSLEFGPGDEILVTDQTYGAVRLAAERAGGRTGSVVVVQQVPLPSRRGADLLDAVLAGVTDRTRLAIVDHIASPTGLVFPLAELTGQLRRRGVLVFVDGAHGPGMVDVDLRALDPDFWTGNFHKWCCAPLGSAGLYVRREHRDRVAPLVTSWKHPEGFPASFGYIGTDDYSPYLAVPAAISFLDRLGRERVRAHNRALARFGQGLVGEALGTLPKELTRDDLFEAMRLVPLPEGVAMTEEDARTLTRGIAAELRTEVSVIPWNGRGYLRLSAHVYNAPVEYERLAEGLPGLIAGR